MLRCIPWKHRVSYVRPNTCCLVTDSLKGSVRGSGAQNPHTGYSTNPGRPEPWNEALFLETPIGLYISVSAFSYECVRNGNPLQYSFLENPMDRGAWQTTEHGVAKSWTWQSNWVHTHIYTHTPCKKLLFHLLGYLCILLFLLMLKMILLVTWSYSTLCDPMDCSLPVSSAYGISQARILKWLAIYFSRGFSQPRDWTRVSCLGRQILCHWPTREAPLLLRRPR